MNNSRKIIVNQLPLFHLSAPDTFNWLGIMQRSADLKIWSITTIIRRNNTSPIKGLSRVILRIRREKVW